MAIFRKVHVSFWKDNFIESLTPEQKYFYLYLLTNSYTTQCGIYEITTRQICFDTGYNDDTVKKLIEFFTLKKKLVYSEQTQEIALRNWGRYNDSTSPKVKACIEKELKQVKNKQLIQYGYSMDTHTQEEQEQEQEREKEVPLAVITTNPLTGSNLFRPAVIPTKSQVWEVFKRNGGTVEQAKSFFDKYEALGWFKNNSPIVNFSTLVPGFITNWNKNESKNKSYSAPSAPPLKKLG